MELNMIHATYSGNCSRPFHGLRHGRLAFPSSELLGYFRSSAARTQGTLHQTSYLTLGLPAG